MVNRQNIAQFHGKLRETRSAESMAGNPIEIPRRDYNKREANESIDKYRQEKYAEDCHM